MGVRAEVGGVEADNSLFCSLQLALGPNPRKASVSVTRILRGRKLNKSAKFIMPMGESGKFVMGKTASIVGFFFASLMLQKAATYG